MRMARFFLQALAWRCV